MSNSLYEDPEEGKLLKKVKENPFMPIGIVGLTGAVAYGAYQFKNKGKMSTSVYLMQLRVGAQSVIVGTLALGVLFNLVNTLRKNYNKKEEPK